MNKKIKEIDNSDLMELLETTSKKDFYRLTLDHELVVRLYNWITNLQKSNEILKEQKKKAIEWVKKHIETYQKNEIVILDWDNFSDPRKLLNILNGGDEELFEITTDKKAKEMNRI